MKNLDTLLKSAKPAVPDLPEGFSKIVMRRISEEGLLISQVPASHRFGSLQLGVGLIALAISLILFNYNSYELRQNGSLELLYFGSQYLVDFIGYLPWDLIIPSLMLTALSTLLFWRSGYLKKGIAVTAIISYLVTGVGGAALASTGFNDQIDAGITRREKDLPWLNMFHHHRAKEFIHHPGFKMGKVEKVMNGNAFVITPNGEEIKIQFPQGIQVKVGQILRMSGMENNAVFSAQKVHVCNPQRVDRYFSHQTHHKQMMKSCCDRSKMMR